MNKLEQAARQALEDLEIYGEHAKDCPQYPTYTRPQDYPKCDCGFEEAITSLREALAEQAEQEPVAWVDEDGFPWKYNLDGKDWVPLYAAPVRTKDLTDIEYLQDAVTKALKKAFHLGQTYWQQADSESYAANKRADVTQELFFKLKDDTRAVIAADREKNNV